MSLNDYARLSNKDLELYKQLSDSSYRSINGKRQNSRNFKEGVLNLGQIHFEQPKNAYTKEMILEYQKEQQNKPAYIDTTTNDQYKYVPSNVNEPLNPYNPILLPSGSAATENDVGNKKFELENVLSNINTLSNEENVIKQLIKNIGELLSKLQQEEQEISNKLNDYKLKEAQTINKIKNIDSNINTKTTKLSGLTQQAAIDRAKKEIEDLERRKTLEEKILNDIQAEIAILQPQEADKQAEIATFQTEDTNAKRDLRNITRNKGLEETKIPNLEVELKQIADNFEQNKMDAAEVKRQNKTIAKQYEEAFNIANLNRINIQQDPNESEQDFINRLQALEQEKFDVNIYNDKAQGEQNKRLSENLKNVIRNNNIIWDVVKSLAQTPGQVFETNKYFNIISTRLLKIFGYDNKNITPKDLQDEIINSLDIIKTEPENIYELEGDDTNPGKTVPETVVPHADTSPSDFKFKVINNSLYIENITTNKGVYIKLGYTDNQKLLFSSDTGLKGSFNRINFKEKTGFQRILKELNLNQVNNKDILLTLFGDDLNKDAIYDRLSGDLTPVDEDIIAKKKVGKNKILYGFGLNKIPETTQFGKNIILLKKLYYNNILSIKDRNLHNIEGIKNVPVSDNFVKIIMDIVTKQKPSLHNINKLNSNEKELYNILLLISGVHKNIKINDTEKTQQINNLKNRLEIAEGEIKAGNDNPVILSELQEIIYKLYHLNAVSLYNARNYLKQFKLSLK